MSTGVRDRLYTQLIVGGKDVPLKDNMIEYIHIVESVRIYLPALTLKFKDTTKFFTRNNLLVDGAPIELTIEAESIRNVYYFRLFSSKERPEQGTQTYIITAYLDVPRYWSESTLIPIRGSVSSALRKICTDTKLNYTGITTADNQLWMPANDRYAEFARRISEHAWVSNTSCCQMAVTLQKEMKLKDVSKILAETPTQYFTNKENSQTQTVITDFAVVNKSGFYNAASGYREMKVCQSLMNPVDQTLKDLDITKNSSKLMMNSAIHNGVGQNKVLFAPIDVGNVSETYERALYQNRRLSNLFSFGLEFITPRQVTAQLMDTVNCELSMPNLDGVEAYNGKYLLTTKVIYIVGINMRHKLEVFRHGLNASDNQSQI